MLCDACTAVPGPPTRSCLSDEHQQPLVCSPHRCRSTRISNRQRQSRPLPPPDAADCACGGRTACGGRIAAASLLARGRCQFAGRIDHRHISFLHRQFSLITPHFPFPLTATRSSHFPFAVRLDRSHFATRPISFPISHFSAISTGRDSIRSSISFPNP